MRYLFVFLAIVVVWVAIIAIGILLPDHSGFSLYLTAQVLTIMLFYVGFWRR